MKILLLAFEVMITLVLSVHAEQPSLIDQGEAALKNDQVENAIKLFNKAIETNLDKAGDVIGLFTKAIEANPNNAKAYCGRANVYLLMERYEKAQHDYNEAVRLNPKYAVIVVSISVTRATEQNDSANGNRCSITVTVRNTSIEDESVFGENHGTDYPVRVYSLHKDGKRTQVYPDPHGSRHDITGSGAMILGPDSSFQYGAFIPLDSPAVKTKEQYIVSVDMCITNSGASKMTEMFSAPFSLPLPR